LGALGAPLLFLDSSFIFAWAGRPRNRRRGAGATRTRRTTKLGWAGLSRWVRNGGNELRFEVNGQMFFVNFVPEEGRWYCYAPTATGVQRIPVSMDGTPFESFTVPMDEHGKEVVN
jgi:hypothetical protein